MVKRQCNNCSSEVPANAPSGMCPKCLLGLGLEKPTAAIAGAPSARLLVPDAEQLVGMFPNLEIQHLIGQGGMGAVYQARQTNLDRLVALKILSPQLNADPAFAERFMREARTLAKLTHPNIVTVYDFGATESMNYLVMEFVDGVNLRDTIESTRFSATEALAVIGQICDALQYAHDQGIVHRDIKPENILVSKQGAVKIADFGLAKLLEPTANDFTLTNTRQVMGTLKYMAPEQIEKPDQVDHRADLYSLGVVFYELLTGELPIGRFALPSAKAEVNRRLDDVVMKTLEKEPAQRYQQASQIKTAVEAAEENVQERSPVSSSEEITAMPATAFAKIPALHYTGDDVYAGLASCFGIARLRDAETLEIEFEVEDCVGAIRTAATTVCVPLASLASAQFANGMFKDTVTIQTDSMSALSEIPSAKRGIMKLYTKKHDAVTAQQLVQEVNRLVSLGCGEQNAPHGNEPTPPIKRASFGSGRPLTEPEQFLLQDNLRIPLLGMWLMGLVHLVLGGFLTMVLIRNIRSGETSGTNELLNGLGEVLYVDGNNEIFWSALISCAFAVVLLGVAWLVRRRSHYGLVMLGSILACAPIHPLAVITLPVAIWILFIIDTPLAVNAFREASDGRRMATGESFSFVVVFGMVGSLVILGGVGLVLSLVYWFSFRATPENAGTIDGRTENTVVQSTDNLETGSANGSVQVKTGSGSNE